jgi:hypothetical protein
VANGKLESTTWRDVKGNTARIRWYVDSTLTDSAAHSAASAVINAITAITNSAFQSAAGPATSVAGPAVYGTAAQFTTVEDKAVMTFTAADGALHRYQIPAPKVSMFEVDQETVNATDTNTAAYITAALANQVTRSGAALTAFVGGIRIRRKLHRKLSIYTLVPELDEPAE